MKSGPTPAFVLARGMRAGGAGVAARVREQPCAERVGGPVVDGFRVQQVLGARTGRVQRLL